MDLLRNYGVTGLVAGILLLVTGCGAHLPRSFSTNDGVANAEAILSPEHQQTSDLMFHLLAAELAGSRSQLPLAVEHYLKAAQLSQDPDVAQRATRISAYAQDPRAAIQAAERWVELDPENRDARQTLALLYVNDGDLGKALEHLQVMLDQAGEQADQEIMKLSYVLAKQSDKARGLQVMKDLQQLYAENPYVYFGQGHLAFQLGELELARASLEKAIAIKPELNDAIALLARVRMSQGEQQASLELMKKLVRENPDVQQYGVAYARLLAEADQYEQARAQFEKLLVKLPADSEILYALSLLSIEAKQLDKAEGYLKRIIKSGQRVDDAHYFLGTIAESRKQYDVSIQHYANVRSGAQQVPAAINIARMLAKKGELVTARAYLSKLREKNPDLESRLYIVESEILREAGKLQEAMAALNEVIARQPDNNDLYYARSLLAEQLGDLALAEQDLRQVLEKDPENVHALNALGYMLADGTQRYQEALELIRRAYALSPDEPAIIDSMGWIMYRMKEYGQSLDYLRRAYALDQDAEIAAHLGEVLWVSGNQSEAKKIWQRALEQEPDNRFIKKVLQRFNQ